MTPTEEREYAQQILKKMIRKAMFVNGDDGHLTQEQEQVLIKLIDSVSKAIDVNSLANDNFAKIENVLQFLLDRYNTGNFYGTIEIKIEGSVVKDPKISNQTFRLREMY